MQHNSTQHNNHNSNLTNAPNKTMYDTKHTHTHKHDTHTKTKQNAQSPTITDTTTPLHNVTKQNKPTTQNKTTQ